MSYRDKPPSSDGHLPDYAEEKRRRRERLKHKKQKRRKQRGKRLPEGQKRSDRRKRSRRPASLWYDDIDNEIFDEEWTDDERDT